MSDPHPNERIRAVLAFSDEETGTLPIVTAGAAVLRAGTLAVGDRTDLGLLRDLETAMIATMRGAPGVGLAAPQIGLPLRLAVAEDPAVGDPDVLTFLDRRPLPVVTFMNPVYEPLGPIASAWEGCLSVPGWQCVVPRASAIRLTCVSASGERAVTELSGWSARIAAHEVDHLDGIICHDLASPRSLASNSSVHEVWGPDVRAAAAALGFDVSGTAAPGGGPGAAH